MRGIFLIAIKHWYNVDMEQDFNKKHWSNPCPKYDCRREDCKCGMRFVSIPAVLGDDSRSSDVSPKNGAYCNTMVKYEANGNVYIYSKEGVPVLLNNDYPISNTMLVTLKRSQAPGHAYSWSSEYTYKELSENLEKIRVDTPEDWLCIGALQYYTPVYALEAEGTIVIRIEWNNFRYEVLINQNGSNPNDNYGWAEIDSSLVENNTVRLVKLPVLELEPYAQEIPENTTIDIPYDQDLSLLSDSTYDCAPVMSWSIGNFIVLPVRRRIGNSSLYNVTEHCLITNGTNRPSSGVPNSYWFKTFEFNGQKYKMSFSSMSGNTHTYVINKIVN